ncbi:MAG: hypothetical protein U0936_11165 [Planctomycetaceae bacterium]
MSNNSSSFHIENSKIEQLSASGDNVLVNNSNAPVSIAGESVSQVAGDQNQVNTRSPFGIRQECFFFSWLLVLATQFKGRVNERHQRHSELPYGHLPVLGTFDQNGSEIFFKEIPKIITERQLVPGSKRCSHSRFSTRYRIPDEAKDAFRYLLCRPPLNEIHCLRKSPTAISNFRPHGLVFLKDVLARKIFVESCT